MVFRLIALDQFPTNPLIIMIGRTYGEIFEVRNPIRNFHDQLAPKMPFFANTEFKESEMNQARE